MKLSKTTWLVIAIGIFVVAGLGLGMVRSQQLDQQSQLNEKLTLAQSNLEGVQLEKLSSRQAELEKQLSQATPQFEEVKAILSQPVDSITASSILFDIAKAHDLEVTEVTSPGPASDSLEGVTLSVLSLTGKVEGDVSNLVSLVTKLNSSLTTGVIKSIEITVLETTSGEKSSTSIQLVVYTYEGG